MTDFTDTLLERFAPYMTPDLQDYLTVVGSMWDELDSYAGLYDEDLGWATVLDADLVPAPALPYLAQFLGERLPLGLSEAESRQWIKDRPNQKRGSVTGIVRAARRTLTGSRSVTLLERTGSGTGGETVEDKITVHTYTSETPDSARVLRDLYSNVPADIKLDYTVTTGQIWGDVKAHYATWALVTAHYATWNEVRADIVGTSTESP